MTNNFSSKTIIFISIFIIAIICSILFIVFNNNEQKEEQIIESENRAEDVANELESTTSSSTLKDDKVRKLGHLI